MQIRIAASLSSMRGDLVLVKVPDPRLSKSSRGRDPRLMQKYVGPLPVLRRIGTVAYKVELPPWWKIHNVFHVSQLKKYSADREDDTRNQPSRPQLELKKMKEKVAEAILDHRVTSTAKERPHRVLGEMEGMQQRGEHLGASDEPKGVSTPCRSVPCFRSAGDVAISGPRDAHFGHSTVLHGPTTQPSSTDDGHPTVLDGGIGGRSQRTTSHTTRCVIGASIHWRASLVPAAAVIPAPIAWTLGWAGRSASGVHRSSRPFCRRCAPGLNWPGRASGAVTLKKLECSKQAYALRTTAKAFAKDVFINQERKLGARRRSDTVLVSTINDADQGSADVAFRTPPAPYEKSKSLGSGGSMVARLKLKGIDGRAPPGVEPAA
ncbi:UNVERIFIED_CONTAM: hypothetical protein Sindi_3091300 [Sesamum indicum]